MNDKLQLKCETFHDNDGSDAPHRLQSKLDDFLMDKELRLDEVKILQSSNKYEHLITIWYEE